MGIVVWNSHETVKCPPGSEGWHFRYGRVRVLESRGWQRLVEVDSEGVVLTRSGAEVSYPERRALLVDVRELERVGTP